MTNSKGRVPVVHNVVVAPFSEKAKPCLKCLYIVKGSMTSFRITVLQVQEHIVTQKSVSNVKRIKVFLTAEELCFQCYAEDHMSKDDVRIQRATVVEAPLCVSQAPNPVK